MKPCPNEGEPYERCGQGSFDCLISDPGPEHPFPWFSNAFEPGFSIFISFHDRTLFPVPSRGIDLRQFVSLKLRSS